MVTAARKPKRVWKGAPDDRRLLVPIDDLRPHPRNPRRHNVAKIVESLDRFGQQRPIIALPDGTIVAGHGTVTGARELGWTHVAAIRTDLADDEIDGYLLADNRTADLGGYDEPLLADLLSEMQERGKLAGTGYEADDVDDLRARANRLAELDRADFQGGYAEDPATLAERARLRAGGAVMREAVLMFTEEQHSQFGVWIRLLRKAYGLDGIVDTVYEAVRREAEHAGSE